MAVKFEVPTVEFTAASLRKAVNEDRVAFMQMLAAQATDEPFEPFEADGTLKKSFIVRISDSNIEITAQTDPLVKDFGLLYALTSVEHLEDIDWAATEPALERIIVHCNVKDDTWGSMLAAGDMRAEYLKEFLGAMSIYYNQKKALQVSG